MPTPDNHNLYSFMRLRNMHTNNAFPNSFEEAARYRLKRSNQTATYNTGTVPAREVPIFTPEQETQKKAISLKERSPEDRSAIFSRVEEFDKTYKKKEEGYQTEKENLMKELDISPYQLSRIRNIIKNNTVSSFISRRS